MLAHNFYGAMNTYAALRERSFKVCVRVRVYENLFLSTIRHLYTSREMRGGETSQVTKELQHFLLS